MPATPMPPNKLEQDIARILGLDLATVIAGSLSIEAQNGGVLLARWDGAMTLTDDQAAAVRRIHDERDIRSNAAQARRLLEDLPAEERRQLLADFEEGPTA